MQVNNDKNEYQDLLCRIGWHMFWHLAYFCSSVKILMEGMTDLKGMKVRDDIISNVRYVDDAVLMKENDTSLQKLFTKVIKIKENSMIVSFDLLGGCQIVRRFDDNTRSHS